MCRGIYPTSCEARWHISFSLYTGTSHVIPLYLVFDGCKIIIITQIFSNHRINLMVACQSVTNRRVKYLPGLYRDVYCICFQLVDVMESIVIVLLVNFWLGLSTICTVATPNGKYCDAANVSIELYININQGNTRIICLVGERFVQANTQTSLL